MNPLHFEIANCELKRLARIGNTVYEYWASEFDWWVFGTQRPVRLPSQGKADSLWYALTGTPDVVVWEA